MSTKEKIIEILQSVGYDFITACEYATNAIKEFNESGDSAMTFNVVANGFVLATFEIKKRG